MKVTSIDITGLHFDQALSHHEAYVTLEIEPVRDDAPMLVHFLCHSARDHESPSTLVTRDLVEDALRQAHRMPGYRRGERVIELADAVAREAHQRLTGT